jgi:hypothetical protein
MKVKHTSAAITGRAKILAGVLALILHGRSIAADEAASPDALQNIEELDVTARKQSALESEAISLALASAISSARK